MRFRTTALIGTLLLAAACGGSDKSTGPGAATGPSGTYRGTLVGTNSGRAAATNAVEGHMWEDFSSVDYRKMPSVGSIEYFNPFSKKFETYVPHHQVVDPDHPGQTKEDLGGGPGFYRPASLISISPRKMCPVSWEIRPRVVSRTARGCS